YDSSDSGACFVFSFFFQAEDGIRDFHVTGVQTCALPIYGRRVYDPGPAGLSGRSNARDIVGNLSSKPHTYKRAGHRKMAGKSKRSEERRVGKECRSMWQADH